MHEILTDTCHKRWKLQKHPPSHNILAQFEFYTLPWWSASSKIFNFSVESRYTIKWNEEKGQEKREFDIFYKGDNGINWKNEIHNIQWANRQRILRFFCAISMLSTSKVQQTFLFLFFFSLLFDKRTL